MSYEPEETLYDHIDTSAKTWDELDSEVQDDLLEWFNSSEPDDEDKARLLSLYVERRFRAWNCPQCASKGEHTRVFCAYPEDDNWDHFQGCLERNFSYFGDSNKYTEEYIQAMCDSCRCYD